VNNILILFRLIGLEIMVFPSCPFSIRHVFVTDTYRYVSKYKNGYRQNKIICGKNECKN